MNTTNLQKLIDFVNTIDPSTFCMGSLFSTTKHCIVTHFYNHKHPNKKPVNSSEVYDYISNHIDIPLRSNKFPYLFSGFWKHEKTNTLDHAVYRINSLLEGYEPDHITEELQKELS